MTKRVTKRIFKFKATDSDIKMVSGLPKSIMANLIKNGDPKAISLSEK